MPDDPFAALASETRRAILELLRTNPEMTAGEIAAAFPRVSRPAVSRHLGVLRAARLVRTTSRGRESHYRVNAEPIVAIYRTFLSLYLPLAEQSLENLKRVVESDAAGSNGPR